jgi:hypothetical protein
MTAYKITLLSVCVPHLLVSFSLQSVSYQRKGRAQFFPDLLVIFRISFLHLFHIAQDFSLLKTCVVSFPCREFISYLG